MPPPQQQVYWDPSQQTYVTQSGQPLAAPPAPTPQGPFAPDLGSAWERAQQALGRYEYALPGGPQQITGLEEGLQAVGPYQQFDWQLPDYAAPTYTPYEYDVPRQETQFATPDIAGVQDISGTPGQIWDARRAATRESVDKQYDDVEAAMLDELRRTRSRPEQAAALLANLAEQREAAQTRAGLGIDVEQSGQTVDIAKGTQSLEANRAIQQAGLEQQTQSMTAQEREALAQFLLSQQKLQGDEGRYAYQEAKEGARFDTGLQQWLQEQQAQEGKAAYESEYGLAQDVAQSQMEQFGANQASAMDYYNALLQGQQAATQGFSQAATYYTNLPEGEQKKAQTYQPQQPAQQPPKLTSTAPAYSTSKTAGYNVPQAQQPAQPAPQQNSQTWDQHQKSLDQKAWNAATAQKKQSYKQGWQNQQGGGT